MQLNFKLYRIFSLCNSGLTTAMINSQVTVIIFFITELEAKRPSNDYQGDAGYQDVIECANALAKVNKHQAVRCLSSTCSVVEAGVVCFFFTFYDCSTVAATANEARGSVDRIYWCYWS